MFNSICTFNIDVFLQANYKTQHKIGVWVQYQADIIIFKLLTAQYHLVMDAFICRIVAQTFQLLMRLFTIQNQFTDTKHDSKILQALFTANTFELV